MTRPLARTGPVTFKRSFGKPRHFFCNGRERTAGTIALGPRRAELLFDTSSRRIAIEWLISVRAARCAAVGKYPLQSR
jgi:hypothetical protein